MADEKQPGTFKLLLRLPGQVIALARAEMANAKHEVSGRIRNLVIGIVCFVLALMVLFWLVATLLTAAIAGLATVWPVWLSALTVSGGALLVVLILALIGFAKVKRGSPVPSETLSRVEKDFQSAGEVKHSVDQVRRQPGQKGKWS